MRCLAVLIVLMFLIAPAAHAQKAALAREIAEYLFKKFGSKVGKGVPELTTRIEKLSLRYGDDALLAVRKGGPSTLGLLESAGEHGAKAAKMVAVHGEQGVTRVLSRPTAMKQFVKFGDDAAVALVKHPGIAEPLIEKGGSAAVKALGALGPQQGRRLAMVMEGEIANPAHQAKLLEVMNKHGAEKVMDFVWKHKATLAGTAALGSFLAHPEPFLSGTRDIASVAGETVAKPVIGGIFSLFNTVLIGVVVLILAVLAVVYRHGPPKAETIVAVLEAKKAHDA